MIRIQSPTRVDLAGGTLDCWPLYLFVDQAATLNLAIDIYTHADLQVCDGQSIDIEVSDLNYKKQFSDLEQALACSDPQLLLVQEILRYVRPSFGFSLRTRSESPVGGGLGGSSSLCISILKAFFQATHRTQDVLDYVELAHNLEARVLHMPTGTQDYVPAVAGGLNILHLEPEGLRVESLPCPFEQISTHLSLVYTGRPHHSGINNWQVIKAAMDRDARTLNALQEIADITKQMIQTCREGRWRDLPPLLNQESSVRVRLSSGFTSPEIESLRELVLQAGADALKICGAGGGGCVLVWAESEVHAKIAAICQEKGFRHLKVNAVPELQSRPAVANVSVI